MSGRAMLLFLFVFAHAYAQAHFKDDCDSLLTAAPIRHTPQRKYPIEIFEAGSVIAVNAPIPPLESGPYLYLITKSGVIIISPKYILADRKKNLVTHKSLLEAYASKTGNAVPPVIVAAGEFQVAFDDVVSIRNKSGNFRGGPETLALAIQLLKRQGLPISQRTGARAVRANAAEDRGHTPKDREIDAFRIEVLKDVHQSMRGALLVELYRRLYFLLRETFPNAVGRDALEHLMDAQAAGAGYNGYYDGYQTFYYPLQTAFSVDGLEYGIWAVERQPDHGGHDSFALGVPKQIDNFLFGAQDHLSPVLKVRWIQLADKFSELQKIRD